MCRPLTASDRGPRDLVARRPVTAFLLLTLPLAWTNMLIPLAHGHPIGTFTLLGALLSGLVGGSIAISALVGGRPAAKALLRRLVAWRIGAPMLATVVLALPALTIAVAAVTHTLAEPPHGWAVLAIAAVLTTLANTLLVNLWEELGWSGFVQTRLMDRHGLLAGSLLTAPAFFAIHWPLVFEEHGLRHTSIGYAVGYFAILGALAPAFRYLIGMVLYQTRGSVLAAGLLHGSLNAAGAMAVVPNAWQHIPAVVILLAILATARARHGLTLVGRPAAPLASPTG